MNKNSIPLVGGKGANLGEMYNIGLPVPGGFVITSYAFKHFIHVTGIDKKIFSILRTLDVENSEKLEKASKVIQDIIFKTEMPLEVKNQVLEAYEMMDVDPAVRGTKVEELIKAGRDGANVAVRSSATAEDLPSISENEYVFVKINEKPFFGRMKELIGIVDFSKDEIYVPAMDNFKVEWEKVSEIYRHKANNNKLYKITTSTGREITISPNHSLIVLDEETLKPKVLQMDSLKTGNKLPVVRVMPNFEPLDSINVLDYVKGNDLIEMDDKIYIKNNSSNWKIQQGLKKKICLNEEFAYFLGIYVAEGCTYKNNCIIITNKDYQILEKVRACFKSLGIRADIKINKYSLRVYCKSLVRLLKEVCGHPENNFKGKGKGCRTKQIPSFIYSANQKIIGEFLKGCFDSDGSIKKDISYCSVSERLVSGMSVLLGMLGINYYLKKKDKVYILSLPSSDLEKFRDKIGFWNIEKSIRLDNLVLKSQKRFSPKNSMKFSRIIVGELRHLLEEQLPKEKVTSFYCPSCMNFLGKMGYYKHKKRYYCSDCKKAFYQSQLVGKEVEKYVNYDYLGRFVSGMIPWNKVVNSYPNYSQGKFLEKLSSVGAMQLMNVFDETLLWDEVIKIEEVNYDSWVYDFCVPNVENFASGFGSIITHNSASFAGMQASFMNIKGQKKLLAGVMACWASLYTARSIYYRVQNKFPHEKVLIAVVVQKMVNSESSGVIFTVNPVSKDEKEIMIESSFGLGEAVVSGAITPDEFVIDKKSLDIIDRKVVKKTWMFTRDQKTLETMKVDVSKDRQEESSLKENDVKKLAEYAVKVEKHYGKPQDMEFAIEKGKIYIVQSRPITTLKKESEKSIEVQVREEEERKVEEKGEIETGDAVLLVSGLPASPGVGKGRVVILYDLSDMKKVKKGDVLVTRMTTPDNVPAMEKASAIVTDAGGSTCHSAIVSRELGIPCIVGTDVATKKMKDGMFVTVDANKGKVYQGNVKIHEQKKEEVLRIKTQIKVKVNVDMPALAEHALATGADGVGLLRSELINMENKMHPVYMIENGKAEEFISHLTEGLKIVAKTFKGKPVWYRTLDARTDEFRNLKGGEDEPEEDNPMMGWRSIRRGLDQPELLKAEFEAIKRVHKAGFTNLGIMLPMVTDPEQVKQAKKLFRENTKIEPVKDIEFGVMVETPAAVQMIEEICQEGISFISFGTNDLTQFTLAVDRDSEKMAKWYNELHPAVLREIHRVIQICKKYKVETSICGQAGSNLEMVKFLQKEGINSISANIDAVNAVRRTVAKAEGLLK